MASLKPRMNTSWRKGQKAMIRHRQAYKEREAFLTGCAKRLPIAVVISQQNRTSGIVISLPLNWLRNSRMVIS